MTLISARGDKDRGILPREKENLIIMPNIAINMFAKLVLLWLSGKMQKFIQILIAGDFSARRSNFDQLQKQLA